MEIKSKQQIVQRRLEIEKDLTDLLRVTGSDFSLQDIRDAIFNESDSNDMMKIIAMFDRGGDATELENVLELVSDAWNYFPHQTIGGKSPAEMVLERQKK